MAGSPEPELKPITVPRLFQFLLELVRGQFYGTVHIRFRAGQIGMITREESWVDDSKVPIADPDAIAMMQTGRYRMSVPQ